MSDFDHSTDESTAAAPHRLLVFGPRTSTPATLPPLQQLPFFALLPLVSFASIFMINADPLQAMIAAGGVCGLYWFAFLRLNPRMVGLALIPIILVPYYVWTERLPNGVYPTLWMAAAALAGGTGAWLTRRESKEDDMIFIPPAICGAAFVVLIWLGTGGQAGQTLEWADQKLRALPQENAAQFRAGGPMEGLFSPEIIDAAAEVTPLELATMLASIWGLSLWIFGRLARRIAGCAQGPRAALILFRVSPRYIFLLIASLAFGILGSLPGWGEWLYVALPLLAMLTMAFVFEGLGVVIFFAALRRAAGNRTAGLVLAVVAITALITFPGMLILALTGLADHWFDFRRLNRITTFQADRGE